MRTKDRSRCCGVHANSVFQGWREKGNLSWNQGRLFFFSPPFFFFLQTMQIRMFVPHWWQTEGIREALVSAVVWLLVKMTPHQFWAYFWLQLSMLNALICHFYIEWISVVWKVIAADVHLMLFILHTAWQIRVVNVSVVILITEAQFV